MSELIRLANLCEKATEPSLERDARIAHAIYGSTGHDVDFYTASIDAALTLVPLGWFWRVGRTSIFQAWAGVHQTHPDHGEADKNEFFFRREPWQPPSTPALALCNVALRARAALTPPAPGAS